jgi:superfamily II DNA or RNA helicase
MARRVISDDLAAAFDSATLGRGAELWERGDKVSHIAASRDGLRVTGRVRGSQRRPYDQTVSIVPTANGTGVRIVGYCTCPVRLNCKHVAALLLEHLANIGPKAAPAAGDAEVAAPAHGVQHATGPVPATAPQLALSTAVSSWLDRVGAATPLPQPAAAAAAYKPNHRKLLFILNPRDTLAGTAPVALVRTVSVRLGKDGGFHDEKRYDPHTVMRPPEQLPLFLTDDDIAILRDIVWVRQRARLINEPDTPLGADAAGLGMLEAMLASGRMRLGAADGPALRAGPEMPAEPRWVQTERGGQRLVFVPAVAQVADQSAGRSAGECADGAAAGRIDMALPLKPPYYIDSAQGLVGPIATALPPALAAEVARAPEITPSEAVLVKGMLGGMQARHPRQLAADRAGASETAAVFPLPPPQAPDNVEMREAMAPIPRLELRMGNVGLQPTYRWYAQEVGRDGAFRLPLARLAFDYGGQVVASDAPVQLLERAEGDRLILSSRDKPAEDKARQQLAEFGLVTVAHGPLQVRAEDAGALFFLPPGKPNAYEIISRLDDPSRFAAFSLDTVPKLIAEGWHVAFSDDYPYRVAEGEAAWWADVGDSSGIDWFSFELGVDYDGHRINLVPHLTGILGRLSPQMLEAARADDGGAQFAKLCAAINFYHTLPDGRMLPLPGARLAPILKALLDLVGPRSDRVVDGRVKLHRAEAGALAAFADGTDKTGFAWAASAERLIGLGQRLKGGVKVATIAPPAGFRAALRPYQAEGLSWLGFLREAEFGGVLADDMGLGKTVQALSFLAHEKAAGRLDKPALIVSPTSVLPNWQTEAARFAPELSVLPLRGLERRQMFDQIARHDLVLTTYPLLARDHEELLAQEFHVAILDEAQAIKNPKAGVSALAHRLNARHRLALTGTPLENNLGEVWSLFEFLSPGLLGDEGTFRRTFRTPIEKHGDVAAQAFLSRRLKPFMLRRTKEEVATELPPKTEIVERVRLEGAQRDLYETVRALMHAKVREEIDRKGLARSHIVFLDALLKLRQICCDPRLLKLPQARRVKGSAKLERLMELLPEMIAEGRRVLLFSQFTSMLALIEAELGRLEIPFIKLTGDTSDRATPVREFQSGKVPLFLLSLKAGGTGLNLTAADTVIHYDPWWNPAVERQATDRAYRIGQDKPVFVYKLIVEDGIEAAIEQLKARKAALAQALFEGTSKTPLDLSDADISALFAPLRSEPMRRAA